MRAAGPSDPPPPLAVLRGIAGDFRRPVGRRIPLLARHLAVKDWLTYKTNFDYALSRRGRGSMKRWRYALLIFELFLFALILILPQVDLPDFTFPGDSAPIVAKARLCSRPAFSLTRATIQLRAAPVTREIGKSLILPAVNLNPLSAVTLNCSLRC